MGTKAKQDPLEAAKITDARRQADDEKASGGTEAAPKKPPPLRTDGPTIESWVLDGNSADDYPPEGYEETPSSGLTRFKASGRVEGEFLDLERARRAPAKATEPVRYVVMEEKRVNVGAGQFSTFKKGHVLDQAGYGEQGIARLVGQGLKLERQKA